MNLPTFDLAEGVLLLIDLTGGCAPALTWEVDVTCLSQTVDDIALGFVGTHHFAVTFPFFAGAGLTTLGGSGQTGNTSSFPKSIGFSTKWPRVLLIMHADLEIDCFPDS
jgi:hypothetical protein